MLNHWAGISRHTEDVRLSHTSTCLHHGRKSLPLSFPTEEHLKKKIHPGASSNQHRYVLLKDHFKKKKEGRKRWLLKMDWMGRGLDEKMDGWTDADTSRLLTLSLWGTAAPVKI